MARLLRGPQDIGTIPLPERFLELPGRPRVEFMTWIKLFEAYATVTRLWEKPEIHKLSMLVLCLGEGYRICQSRHGPKSTMEEMIETMTRHYKPLG